MWRLPLCCGEGNSFSPVAFGHGALHVSPLQSKHQLVSSAAAVSTHAYWLLVYRFTAAWRGRDKQVPYKHRPLHELLFLNLRLKIKNSQFSWFRVHYITDWFTLWIVLVWTDFRLHHWILQNSLFLFSLQLHPQPQLSGESIHTIIWCEAPQRNHE